MKFDIIPTTTIGLYIMDYKFVDLDLAEFLRERIAARAKAALPVFSSGAYDGPDSIVKITTFRETSKSGIIHKIEPVKGWDIAYECTPLDSWRAFLLDDGTFADQTWAHQRGGGSTSVVGARRIEPKELGPGQLIRVYSFLGRVLASKNG